MRLGARDERTALHLLVEIQDIVRPNVLNELDVFIAMESCHLFADRLVWTLETERTVFTSEPFPSCAQHLRRLPFFDRVHS